LGLPKTKVNFPKGVFWEGRPEMGSGVIGKEGGQGGPKRFYTWWKFSPGKNLSNSKKGGLSLGGKGGLTFYQVKHFPLPF